MDNINSEDKVWVTIDRTINLGNYESIKISAGLSRTIKEKEVPQHLIESISDTLISILKQKGKEYKKFIEKKNS